MELDPDVRPLLNPDVDLVAVRNKAQAVFKYRCIETRFLELTMCRHPAYPAVLERAKTESVIDIGCCFGQDVAKLKHDGAPNVEGLELRPEFAEMAKELFGLSITVGDLYSVPLNHDIIYLSAVLHLFDWNGQVDACSRLNGRLIFGSQAGSDPPGEHRNARGELVYWHNPESFRRMWDVVGERNGTKWDVQAFLDQRLYFEVRRV